MTRRKAVRNMLGVRSSGLWRGRLFRFITSCIWSQSFFATIGSYFPSYISAVIPKMSVVKWIRKNKVAREMWILSSIFGNEVVGAQKYSPIPECLVALRVYSSNARRIIGAVFCLPQQVLVRESLIYPTEQRLDIHRAVFSGATLVSPYFRKGINIIFCFAQRRWKA